MRESVTFTRTQDKRATLEAHYSLYRYLMRGRFETNFVPGDGHVNSDIVLVGEAPGVHEDKARRPFVGKSGEYLDDLLHSVDMKRGDLFITNFLKYRPPDNRDPEGDEVHISKYMLRKELEILNPRIVVTLGRFSTSLFFDSPHMGTLAGQMWVKQGLTVIPMFHPAAAMYDTSGDTDARMRLDIRTVGQVFHGLTTVPIGKTRRPSLVKLTK